MPATRCLVIFVAVDEEGRSTPVPALVPRTLGEELEERWAARRADLRAEVEAAMAGQVYTAAGTAPRVVMRFLAAPTDVNWGGKVHGGIVMRWIDEAAHVLATQWTGSAQNVAIFTGGVRFYRPLRIGHVVEVEARLLHTGRTSMHVGVHVRSGDPAQGRDGVELTTYCRTVFVAIDEERRAVPCPTWYRPTTRTGRGRPRGGARPDPRAIRRLTRRGQGAGSRRTAQPTAASRSTLHRLRATYARFRTPRVCETGVQSQRSGGWRICFSCVVDDSV